MPFRRCTPTQRERAQTASSAGSSPAIGTRSSRGNQTVEVRAQGWEGVAQRRLYRERIRLFSSRCSSVGRARRSGRRGRWFEPTHFDRRFGDGPADGLTVATRAEAGSTPVGPSILAPVSAPTSNRAHRNGTMLVRIQSGALVYRPYTGGDPPSSRCAKPA